MDSKSTLLRLYSEHWNELISTRNEIANSHGPYLCSPGKEYLDSLVKLVIVGQETNGWSRHNQIVEQMQTYEKFDLGKKYVSSPFWNVIRKIEKGVIGKQYCSASLNLNKFDVNGKPPRENNLAKIEKFDTILNLEILALKPDAVIFFTGWKYDKRIENCLNSTVEMVPGFNRRELGQIKLANEPIKIFRTYHPNYLRRSGKEAKIIDEIINRLIS